MDKDTSKDTIDYWVDIARRCFLNTGEDPMITTLDLAAELRRAYIYGIERGRWISDNAPR